MKVLTPYILICMLFLGFSCQKRESGSVKTKPESSKMKILIDTDANNELDDQHALAYAFLNANVFEVVGVTVNNTINGEGIQGHYDDAYRIISLFNLQEKMPLKRGAVGRFSEILPFLGELNFDGSEAVNFIIDEAQKVKNKKLILIPIGKLTNIALALKKAPEIKDKVKVVWLGSNYPDPGEYNLENDSSSVNPVIESGVEFEIVTVRYGMPSGTAAVTVTRDEIRENLAGKGLNARFPVTGRHGGTFNNFGDYSVNLFEQAEMYGNPPSRALFDMAAIAIVKNPSWAVKHEIPSPRLLNGEWYTPAENDSKIIYWENFDRDSIISDFFNLMEKLD